MVLACAGAPSTMNQAAGVNAAIVGHLAHLVLGAVLVLLTFHLGATQW
jgi:hypothetical protein